MSIYNIPLGINTELRDKLLRSLPYIFRPTSSRGYIIDENTHQPIALEFIPDLTEQEQIALDTLFGYALSINDFETLPNWSSWTTSDVETNITTSILHGWDKLTADSQIDALPATIVGMKTGLKELAEAIIDIRTILIAMGKAIIYLRNLVVKIR